jgi:hypothetical protein
MLIQRGDPHMRGTQRVTHMRQHNTFWRGHPAGIWIIETAAGWVAQQAKLRGLSLHDYVEGRCLLVDLGITVADTEATLQPLMPCGHLAYEAWSGRDDKFDSWRDWYVRRLLDRIRYFFLKHRGTRTYRYWGEWPLPIPRQERSLH